MKRLGNLVPQICTRENIERSIKVVLRGSNRKETKEAKYILSHMDEVIDETIKVISDGSFRLGKYVQQTIKEGVKERVIQILNYRYCDDIVILGPNKEYLWKLHHKMVELLKDTKLTIKPNYRVFPLSTGLDYLGFVIYDGIYSRVRKRIKRNAQYKLSYLKSPRRRQEIIASIKGYCLHCNGHHLFNTLTAYGNKNTRREQPTG